MQEDLLVNLRRTIEQRVAPKIREGFRCNEHRSYDVDPLVNTLLELECRRSEIGSVARRVENSLFQ